LNIRYTSIHGIEREREREREGERGSEMEIEVGEGGGRKTKEEACVYTGCIQEKSMEG